MEKMTEKQRSELLDKTNDIAERLSDDITNLAGTACLLSIELDDNDKIYPVHRSTMNTIKTLLERLSEDADALTDCMATLRHDQLKRNTVYVPMTEYEAVNRDLERCRAKYGMK